MIGDQLDWRFDWRLKNRPLIDNLSYFPVTVTLYLNATTNFIMFVGHPWTTDSDRLLVDMLTPPSHFIGTFHVWVSGTFHGWGSSILVVTYDLSIMACLLTWLNLNSTQRHLSMDWHLVTATDCCSYLLYLVCIACLLVLLFICICYCSIISCIWRVIVL